MSEEPTGKLPNSQGDTLTQILSAVQNLSARVESLEGKVEERLYDTRPIWEKVQADIVQLQEGQRELTEGQKGLEEGQKGLTIGLKGLEEKVEALRDEMRTGFRDLKRQFSVLNDTFLEVRADYKDLDKRVFHLEGQRT